MSKKAHFTVPTAPPQEEIDLEQTDEAILAEEAEQEVSRAKNLAGQRLIWENRHFILRWMGIGLLVSTVIAFLIPKRFESTARLMPPDQGSSGMGMALLAASSKIGSDSGSGLGAMAGDLLGLKNSSDLFIGILQSRTVQDDLINKFELKKIYWDKRMEDARDDLNKRTSLSADRKTGIITISAVDNSPTRAAAMAGEYLNELNRVVTVLNTSSAHRERVFLEERLSQVKQDLEAAEKGFSEFATKNTALDIPAQGKAMIEGLGTLEGQYIAAQTELEGLKQLYSDRNVRVRSTEARVQELRRQLDKILGSKANGATATAGPDLESSYPSIRELPALGVSYADLYRNTKIQEAVFQTLTQEFELAKVQEAKETPSIKVLDPPNVPEKKSFPPRLPIMMLGTILAMMISTIWVFGKKAWNQVEDDDPQKLFAQEVFHTIRARIPWASTNGSGPSATSGEARSQFHRTSDQSQDDL
jgi:uncharacterized protein involved in exopolysaccharide biosynthesis